MAKLQLLHAIQLFCNREHLVSAITLAGAAEEVLGKLVERNGAMNALQKEISDQCEMFEIVFGRTADPKLFYELENFARNNLKHLGSQQAVELDIEQEVLSLIERAIVNYQKIDPRPVPAFNKFDDSAAAWWRKRSATLQ